MVRSYHCKKYKLLADTKEEEAVYKKGWDMVPANN
jgi:hypothetical protein